MLLGHENNKRILIYCFNDKKGIVDEYVDVVLRAMSQICEEMFVVTHSSINGEGKRLFDKYAEVFYLSQSNSVMESYGSALERIGWKNLVNIDEIVFMSDSLMGPVNSVEDMFVSMEKEDVDFWGLSKVLSTHEDSMGGFVNGIHSGYLIKDFIVVRNRMMLSKMFRRFWKENSYVDEIIFTQLFQEANYKWTDYVNCTDDNVVSYKPLLMKPLEMVREFNLPFFLKDSFCQNYDYVLSESIGCKLDIFLDYIDNETEYRVEYIWKNILRTQNMADIKKNLQLNYVLSLDSKKEISVQRKIALVMHIYFEDLIEECRHYAKSMPDNVDIYITTNSEQSKKIIEESFKSLKYNKLDVRVVPNRGRDVGPFLVEFKKYIYEYDYVCHVHDKKVGQIKPLSVGKSFSEKCFENVLATKGYVENILALFEENQRLGILMPPPPNHANYFIMFGLEWGCNYQITKELAETLGIDVPIEENKEPMAPLGSVFWARTDALRSVFDYSWEYDDFPEEPIYDDGTILHAIERIYGFAAQSKGYYSGWVLNQEFAEKEYNNVHHMLRTINEILIKGIGLSGSYLEVVEKLKYISGDIVETRDLSRCVATLFYGSDNVFSEKQAFKAYPSRDGYDCVWKFDNMSEAAGFYLYRFDPCEIEGLMLKYIRIIIEKVDGSKTLIDNSRIKSNGRWIKDQLIFVDSDPQIVFKINKKTQIRSIEVRALAEFTAISVAIKELINSRI